MNEFENLKRLTSITTRMPKSPWRKITFLTILILALAAAAFLAIHDFKHNIFGVSCALAVAGISAYVLATGYAVRRF